MCVNVTPIYTDTLKSLRYGQRRIIHQGGSYSGKTVNILGALATLASEEKSEVNTVTSMSFPHLRGGAMRDFENYVYPTFKNAISRYHKTDHIYTFKSGSIIEFKVFENEMAARGQKRKRLFINEANHFQEMVFFQLDTRSEQTVIDYNPSIRFWAHTNLIGLPGNLTLYSDHRHNPFLSKDKHAEIENICTFSYLPDGSKELDAKGNPVVLEGSYELWKVYARGITGNVTGLIFPNWELIEDHQFPDHKEIDKWIYSIDFGYTNDPTAMVKMCIVGDTLLIKELCYEPGLSARSIKMILDFNGYDAENDPLFCEHDPDMIKQLRKCGVMAFPARKGAGSVKAGIELLNTYKCKYTVSSMNLHKEKSLYIWMVDKEDGKPTNIPVDKNNHLFDAIRYGVYTKYLRN